jgi:hypothetical protein
MEDSNFSNLLGQADMEESDLACCKEGGGKPYNEEGLHSFFKEKIQSQNPGLFNTIESILEEEKGEGEASKAAAARSSESGDSRHKKPAYMDSNHSVSASSLNLSEPSLLETSTDKSPLLFLLHQNYQPKLLDRLKKQLHFNTCHSLNQQSLQDVGPFPPNVFNGNKIEVTYLRAKVNLAG